MSLDGQSYSQREKCFLWHAATKFAVIFFFGRCDKFLCSVLGHFLVRSGPTEITVETFHLLNRLGMSGSHALLLHGGEFEEKSQRAL